MKQPWEWDEDDLVVLITTGTKETIELEYKACGALDTTSEKKKAYSKNSKNEVSKDVSAFANSAGGTIVYGMIENGCVPIRLDSGYDPSVISKEWLEQVINSRIQRRIDGVRINQVELTKTSPGKVAYVVYVPQSMRAPHQAADKKFYKRFNFESVAMEEYEIRDVSRRSEAPDLRLWYQLSEEPTADHAPDEIRVHLMPTITNESITPAEYVFIRLLIDARLPILSNNRDLTKSGTGSEVGGVQWFQYTRFDIKYSVPFMMPLFYGVNIQLLGQPLSIRIPELGRYLVAWQLQSSRMTPKLGASFLVWDGKTAQLQTAQVPQFMPSPYLRG